MRRTRISSSIERVRVSDGVKGGHDVRAGRILDDLGVADGLHRSAADQESCSGKTVRKSIKTRPSAATRAMMGGSCDRKCAIRPSARAIC